MSLETAGLEIRQAIEDARTAWSDYALEVCYDGLEQVDSSIQVLPKIVADIMFIDGGQIAFGHVRTMVQYGQIHIIAAAPCGAGSRRQQKLLDHFTNYLELKSWALVKTHAAAGHKDYDERGWNCWPLIVPFWYHRTRLAP